MTRLTPVRAVVRTLLCGDGSRPWRRGVLTCRLRPSTHRQTGRRQPLPSEAGRQVTDRWQGQGSGQLLECQAFPTFSGFYWSPWNYLGGSKARSSSCIVLVTYMFAYVCMHRDPGSIYWMSFLYLCYFRFTCYFSGVGKSEHLASLQHFHPPPAPLGCTGEKKERGRVPDDRRRMPRR